MQRLREFIVWVRCLTDGCLTRVYESAITADEAVEVVRQSIDERNEKIEDVYVRIINWRRCKK